jgi:hypothetical protein
MKAREHMHIIAFTSTRSYVDRDEMVFSWVRQTESFVLRKLKKSGLSRSGLLSGTVNTKMMYCPDREYSHPRVKWLKKQHR